MPPSALCCLQAKKTLDAATLAFEKVRSRRSELFMAAFDHIARSIDAIYKELTRSAHHAMGGQAYLTLEEDESEPYLHGIKYVAMPPSKRYRDMELLSGERRPHTQKNKMPGPPRPVSFSCDGAVQSLCKYGLNEVTSICPIFDI